MHRLANRELTLLGLGAVAAVLVLSTLARSAQAAEEKSTPAIATVDGMPAVLDPSNVYSEAGSGTSQPCSQRRSREGVCARGPSQQGGCN